MIERYPFVFRTFVTESWFLGVQSSNMMNEIVINKYDIQAFSSFFSVFSFITPDARNHTRCISQIIEVQTLLMSHGGIGHGQSMDDHPGTCCLKICSNFMNQKFILLIFKYFYSSKGISKICCQAVHKKWPIENRLSF